jgi:hypothetical protein
MKKSIIAAAAALSLSMACGMASAQSATAATQSQTTGNSFAASGGIPGGSWTSFANSANTSAAISNFSSTGAGATSLANTASTGNTTTNAGVAGVGNGGAGANATQNGTGQSAAQGTTLSILSPPTAIVTSGSLASVGTRSDATAAGFTGNSASNSLANAQNLTNANVAFGGLSGSTNSTGFANMTLNTATNGIGQTANANGLGLGGVGAVQNGSGVVSP